MTQEEITTKILHGLHLLRSTPGLPDQLDLSSGALLDAALRSADEFADSKAIDEASAAARANPQGTRAFLLVADRLPIEHACKLDEFSIAGLAASHDIALPGLWLQGTVRSAGFDLQGLLQSLDSR